MGHSSVLAEIDGRRVLFDPVWGERCSPFPFAGPKRLHPVPLPLAALGPVDVVVISHDHYDHLDMPTIKELAGTDTVFAVPLGVGAHLEHWGVSADRLRELDWHESTQVAGLTLTATPARHFCGRGLRNTQHTLWASWVVAGGEHRIYHSGDTGYFDGFKDIGAAFGPFDATMIQLGAYSEFWPDIHMTPEEAVRSHLDLQGGDAAQGVLLPIHWGTFNLATHPWVEPAERTMLLSHKAGVAMATPRPGEPFEPGATPVVDPWWRGWRGRRPGDGPRCPRLWWIGSRWLSGDVRRVPVPLPVPVLLLVAAGGGVARRAVGSGPFRVRASASMGAAPSSGRRVRPGRAAVRSKAGCGQETAVASRC